MDIPLAAQVSLASHGIRVEFAAQLDGLLEEHPEILGGGILNPPWADTFYPFPLRGRRHHPQELPLRGPTAPSPSARPSIAS